MKDPAYRLRVGKTALIVIVVNSLQIAMMLLILVLEFLVDGVRLPERALAFIGLAAAAVVITGACLNIRDALNARRLAREADGMADTIRNMAELNNTLRAQRHDFLNHLQVVFSLMEMGETEEANRYIERVYGQISAVSRVMKTASPAVNALLRVKLAECERAGIPVTLTIQSDWSALPIEDWAMCKVLSNLIDNAIDAVREKGGGAIAITLSEDLHSLRFEVRDSGAPIPEDLAGRLFEAGATGKSDGHGMGLYIVRQTLRQAGGDIGARAEGDETVFAGSLPKAAPETAEGGE